MLPAPGNASFFKDTHAGGASLRAATSLAHLAACHGEAGVGGTGKLGVCAGRRTQHAGIPRLLLTVVGCLGVRYAGASGGAFRRKRREGEALLPSPGEGERRRGPGHPHWPSGVGKECWPFGGPAPGVGCLRSLSPFGRRPGRPGARPWFPAISERYWQRLPSTHRPRDGIRGLQDLCGSGLQSCRGVCQCLLHYNGQAAAAAVPPVHGHGHSGMEWKCCFRTRILE